MPQKANIKTNNNLRLVQNVESKLVIFYEKITSTIILIVHMQGSVCLFVQTWHFE